MLERFDGVTLEGPGDNMQLALVVHIEISRLALARKDPCQEKRLGDQARDRLDQQRAVLLVLRINGVLAVETTDDKASNGFIALQLHSINNEDQLGLRVLWKNIRIHELD